MRVVVLESRDSVRVGLDGRRLTRVEPAGAGLRAAGRDVGPVYRVEGGRLRVESLRLRGRIEVQRSPEGLRVVNRVPLEHYVAGTLGSEVYHSWSPEALKAQAVAARTYALHEAARRQEHPYDLTGDTRGQVYGGTAAEAPAVVAAARATAGQYLAWEGRPILAAYHSAAGGRTASAEEVWGRPLPYLVSVAVDDEQDSPDTYWRAAISRPTLGPALASLGVQVGSAAELRVVERSPSGRARAVQVRGRRGEATVEARALRRALGADLIRSTLFDIRPSRDGVVFVGSGHGHGVGMSQWGAEAMARSGAGYREILAAFYPGAELRQWEGR